MTIAHSHVIPAGILQSPLMQHGGFIGYGGMLDTNAVNQLRAEAAINFRKAMPQVCDCDDYADGRGGTPRRSLLTAEGGEVQDDLYRSPALSESLSDACGLHVVPSGNRGSYSYYARSGDFLDLHRDVETCEEGTDADNIRVVLSRAALRWHGVDRAAARRLRVAQTCGLHGWTHMTRPTISGIAPFFIVRSVPVALSFYRNRLGFDVTFEGPSPDDVFFGIVERDRAMIMLKAIGVEPVPNHTRDVNQGSARWDAYLHVPDPDALAAEFMSREVELSQPLADDDDGLRGFALKDADGYVLYFGRPRA